VAGFMPSMVRASKEAFLPSRGAWIVVLDAPSSFGFGDRDVDIMPLGTETLRSLKFRLGTCDDPKNEGKSDFDRTVAGAWPVALFTIDCEFPPAPKYCCVCRIKSSKGLYMALFA
jgi:hypothetical protein